MVVAVFGVSYIVKDEAIYLADGEGRRDVRLRVLRLQKAAPPGSHRAILRWSGGGRGPRGGNSNKGGRGGIRLGRKPSLPVLSRHAARGMRSDTHRPSGTHKRDFLPGAQTRRPRHV